jgi:rRNA-processing protein FCF1
LVKVVCDTSFLMLLSSRRIKNINSLETEIGNLEFLVPDLVISELEKISSSNDKKKAMH